MENNQSIKGFGYVILIFVLVAIAILFCKNDFFLGDNSTEEKVIQTETNQTEPNDEEPDEARLNLVRDFRVLTNKAGTIVIKNRIEGLNKPQYTLGIFDAKGYLMRPVQTPLTSSGYDIIGFSPAEDYVYFFNTATEDMPYSPLYQLEVSLGAVRKIANTEGLNRESVNMMLFSEDRSKIIIPYVDQNIDTEIYSSLNLINLTTGKSTTVFKDKVNITSINYAPDKGKIEIKFTKPSESDMEHSLLIDNPF